MPDKAIDQAVFCRIDTADGQPYFDGVTCAELAVNTIIQGRDKGWYELVGFVVLPKEIQLLIVPRRLALTYLVPALESDIYPMISGLKPVNSRAFDADFYREKVDCDDECRQRLKWMHLAPVRARLANSPDQYAFSSASPHYRETVLTWPSTQQTIAATNLNF